MTKKPTIIGRDNPILRARALPVPMKEIGSKKINNILKQMSDAMHAEVDGVAIAAPQIGESLRIFMVNTKALDLSVEATHKHSHAEDLVFINPEILKLSQKKVDVEEGCLSVRYLYGKVRRSEKALVRAYGASGKQFECGAEGLLAQIFQHEMDHLEGVLFTDKAVDVRDLPPLESTTR